MTRFQTATEGKRIRIEEELSRRLPPADGEESRMIEAARYSLLGGGKRIRPVMLLVCGDMLSIPESETMPYACALEMIHTYSLIHDDLPCMDDDDLRRNRPTCHRQYDEATALLAGDALLNSAFEILLETCGAAGSTESAAARIRAARRIASAAGTGGMIGGQAIDLHIEGMPADERTLDRMHRMKTGALIEASLLVPADLASAGSDLTDALTDYAAGIGLAFQIGDDLLDATSMPGVLGKSVGKDARDGKSTYVTRLGIKRSQERLREEVAHALNALEAVAAYGFDTVLLAEFARSLTERKS